eukprot:TRINITY_DN2555_c0_g1_i5.p1 TRINITY_DN2555_c0_g1~~TRINITY_DN2555_c0_g1_i5.p1  ORF type:complete len:1072 (+),score=212.97 TRINITY_DN2555_c0_g1_i5:72-3287(+)
MHDPLAEPTHAQHKEEVPSSDGDLGTQKHLIMDGPSQTGHAPNDAPSEDPIAIVDTAPCSTTIPSDINTSPHLTPPAERIEHDQPAAEPSHITNNTPDLDGEAGSSSEQNEAHTSPCEIQSSHPAEMALIPPHLLPPPQLYTPSNEPTTNEMVPTHMNTSPPDDIKPEYADINAPVSSLVDSVSGLGPLPPPPLPPPPPIDDDSSEHSPPLQIPHFIPPPPLIANVVPPLPDQVVLPPVPPVDPIQEIPIIATDDNSTQIPTPLAPESIQSPNIMVSPPPVVTEDAPDSKFGRKFNNKYGTPHRFSLQNVGSLLAKSSGGSPLRPAVSPRPTIPFPLLGPSDTPSPPAPPAPIAPVVVPLSIASILPAVNWEVDTPPSDSGSENGSPLAASNISTSSEFESQLEDDYSPPRGSRTLFDDDDNADNITLEPRDSGIPLVKGGSLVKLVERLTHHEYADPAYLVEFLLTYRSFSTPHELLDHLSLRFIHPYADTSKRTHVRLRVFNVIKFWVTNHFQVDFADDPGLVEKLQTFVCDLETSGMKNPAQHLAKLLVRVQSEDVSKSTRSNQPSEGAPKPILMRVKAKKETAPVSVETDLADIDPEEIARQLTILDHSLFRQIKQWEFFGLNWTKKPTSESLHSMGESTNIKNSTNNFNKISKWAVNEILRGETPKARASALTRIIQIAGHCRDLNNFNMVISLLAGLNSSPIARLHQSWPLIKNRDLLSELNFLVDFDGNFRNMRGMLHKVEPPAIPYLGMYLTDLVFIEEGNPTLFRNTGQINFVKCRLMSNVIQEVQQFQRTPYNLQPVPWIQEAFEQMTVLTDENLLYKMSLDLEQRESDSSGSPNSTSSAASSSGGTVRRSRGDSLLGMSRSSPKVRSPKPIPTLVAKDEAGSPSSPETTVNPLLGRILHRVASRRMSPILNLEKALANSSDKESDSETDSPKPSPRRFVLPETPESPPSSLLPDPPAITSTSAPSTPRLGPPVPPRPASTLNLGTSTRLPAVEPLTLSISTDSHNSVERSPSPSPAPSTSLTPSPSPPLPALESLSPGVEPDVKVAILPAPHPLSSSPPR